MHTRSPANNQHIFVYWYIHKLHIYWQIGRLSSEIERQRRKKWVKIIDRCINMLVERAQIPKMVETDIQHFLDKAIELFRVVYSSHTHAHTHSHTHTPSKTKIMHCSMLPIVFCCLETWIHMRAVAVAFRFNFDSIIRGKKMEWFVCIVMHSKSKYLTDFCFIQITSIGKPELTWKMFFSRRHCKSFLMLLLSQNKWNITQIIITDSQT